MFSYVISVLFMLLSVNSTSNNRFLHYRFFTFSFTVCSNHTVSSSATSKHPTLYLMTAVLLYKKFLYNIQQEYSHSYWLLLLSFTHTYSFQEFFCYVIENKPTRVQVFHQMGLNIRDFDFQSFKISVFEVSSFS